jgi:hypothetical protein
MRYQIEAMDRWPYPATSSRKSSPFRASWADTLELLGRELNHLQVSGAVAMRIVATQADVRLDGMLRASARLQHPGVILSFTSKHGRLSYPCDTFEGYGSGVPSWQVNVRAIALALEALRKVDRYGVTRHGEQYSGWQAIEAGPAATFFTADEALRWLREFTNRPAENNRATLLRCATRLAHPDTGGKSDDWERVDAARQLLQRPQGGAT